MSEKCLECDKTAVWTRHTQFAGDHPYCDEHARLEKDFGEDDSYTFWSKEPCARCGKVHTEPPVDPDKIVADHAAEIARQIDLEVIAMVGGWMDEDKNYGIGTREKHEEFVRKRNGG